MQLTVKPAHCHPIPRLASDDGGKAWASGVHRPADDNNIHRQLQQCRIQKCTMLTFSVRGQWTPESLALWLVLLEET